MIFVKVVNGLVVESIVADQDFMDSYKDTTAGTWLETKEDGSIRNIYAGVGFTYDAQNDVFIEPQLYNSWVLNNETFKWQPPVTYPDDGEQYKWDESSESWVIYEHIHEE